MDNPFSVTFTEYERFIHCLVSGSTLSVGLTEFENALKHAAAQGGERVEYFVVDYSGVSVFTSACINVIISIHDVIERGKRRAVVITPVSDAVDLLEATGFSRIYPVYATLQAFLRDTRIPELLAEETAI
jgi:anti-anti-sigma factor